ncbi:MAG: endonuclease/exonuclease/phosphatase family protein, partial [Bacteroidales bacterium]|nr:endonuclease/exonuclease/phosphatase family protein [Bacteroidales bacterium]
MKRILSILFSVSCLMVVSAAGRDADTLKVMTYNLRFGELASMEDIGNYISSEAPDIVALQECDWATYRERAPHQNGVKFINELS